MIDSMTPARRASAMMSRVWTKAINSCADPARARHFLTLLAASSAKPFLQKAPADQAAILAALFSGSQASSMALVSHPDWLGLLAPVRLRFPRRKQGLQSEVSSWLEPLLASRNYATAFTHVREFKQRQMLRIAARDLARLGGLTEIISEISDVADVCLETVWAVCHRHLAERYGTPYHQ